MRTVGLICIMIATLALTGSCQKESIGDYVPYPQDTINNPEGLLENYGAPYNALVDYWFFYTSNWIVTVKTESSPDKVYYMSQSSRAMYGFEVLDPTDSVYYEISYNDPYDPYYKNQVLKMEYTIYNGDPKVGGQWFKYGTSYRLILAKRGVTLILTKR